MSKYDITGQVFDYLTVIGRDYSSVGQRNSKWFCRCVCGNVVSIVRCSLVSGHTTSCGCKHFESHNATHHMSKTRIYGIWCKMNERCRKLRDNNKKYIERGITVCEEWQTDFMSFYNWAMDNGYSDELTIDRINNDRGYSPENCRWITRGAQQSNKTNNIKIYYQGSERCLYSVCVEMGFPFRTAFKRYHRMLSRGEEPTVEKLFAPIHTEKIAKRFRCS